MQVFYAIDN